MYKIFLFLLLISFSIGNSKAANITNIKSTDRKDYIRITFEINKKPNYKIYQQNNKIFILLKNTNINKTLTNNIEKFDIINSIVSIKSENQLKFIIILNNNTKLKRYLYTEPDKYHNYRLIVDIDRKDYYISTIDDLISKKVSFSETQQTKNYDNLDKFITNNINTENKYENISDLIETNVEAKDVNELLALNNLDIETAKDLEYQNNDKIDIDDFLENITKDIETNTIIKNKKEIKIELADKIINKRDKYIVVIDAGHGGKDPGAIGFNGTKEKNINFEYTRIIKQELEKNKNIKVFLTRSGDQFIELKNRINKARILKADLFISIHSDSNKNKQSRGLSVYTISEDTINKKINKQLNTNIFSNININKTYKQIQINKKQSDGFANILIENFNRNKINTINNPHKHAGFAVLMSSDFPSVLIELGFISNKKDEKMLKSNSYKKQIAKSISNAIESYMNIK